MTPVRPAGGTQDGADGVRASGDGPEASAGGQACPFELADPGIRPEDPCPVCGDLGTWASVDEPSRCVGAWK